MYCATRRCDRVKRNGEPCKNMIRTHWAACLSHMNDEEKGEADALDEAIEQHERQLDRALWRRAVLRYARWRSTLPDLTAITNEDDQWNLFVDTHEGRCGACRRGPDKVLDHDHRTGLVRGLLCKRCNSMPVSSIVHKNHWRVRGLVPVIALYCQYPPAAVMGVCIDYAHPLGFSSISEPRRLIAL